MEMILIIIFLNKFSRASSSFNRRVPKTQASMPTTLTKSLKSFTLVSDHIDRNEEWLNEENLSNNEEKHSGCESSTNENCKK